MQQLYSFNKLKNWIDFGCIKFYLIFNNKFLPENQTTVNLHNDGIQNFKSKIVIFSMDIKKILNYIFRVLKTTFII